MKVNVVNTRRQSRADRHGWKADFKIEPKDLPADKKTPVAIYQNVSVKMGTVDNKGETDKWASEFTEAWPYKRDRQVTDSFLVPVEWRRGTKGFMDVAATVWAQTGKVNPNLKKGDAKNKEHWGNLYGSKNLLTPKAPTTKRTFSITWDNLDRHARFAGGNDLSKALEKNI